MICYWVRLVVEQFQLNSAKRFVASMMLILKLLPKRNRTEKKKRKFYSNPQVCNSRNET